MKMKDDSWTRRELLVRAALSPLLVVVSLGCRTGDPPRTPDGPSLGDRAEWINSLDMRFRVIPPGDVELEIPVESDVDDLSARGRFLREARGDPPLPPPGRRPARVTQAYSISVCEVTRAEFQKLMGTELGRGREPEQPAGVSWSDAAEFCRRLSQVPEETKAGRSYRLPTQAEWQLADSDGCYPWGHSTQHVSVWNWCLDFFDPEFYRTLPEDEPILDPRGAPAGSSHVVMCSYSHPDPFRRLMAFRVVAESGSVVVGSDAK